MKGIYDAVKLGAYIAKKISEKNNKEISPVKLQKALYFCFAYWGAYVRQANMEQCEQMENDLKNQDEFLFYNRIEAWVYGPVVPDVYRKFNEGTLMNEYSDDVLDKNLTAKEFVDEMIDDIKDVSDFRLVDISHADNSWKDAFDFNDFVHNTEIKKDIIIDEYSKRK